MSRSHTSLPSSLRGACWPLPSRGIRRIQNLGCLFTTPQLVQAHFQSPSAHTSDSTKTTLRGSSFFHPWLSAKDQLLITVTPHQLFCHPQFCFFILVFGWFHPGFGWFHPGFWVGFILVFVLEWFHIGLEWFHTGLGWFHHGFILDLGGFILVLGGFIQVFCVLLVFVFFPTDHDTQTTVILSTQTAFICHPLTSRPTQDKGICSLANCNNRETLTLMGLPSSVLFPRLHRK